jgi:cytochrome c oxidase cbb3-type subunit III
MKSLVVGVLLVVVATGCSTSEANLIGEDLYVHSCAMCHGLDGRGGIGVDIGADSNADLNLTDEQISGVIRVGPGNMPAFSRLTAEQVESLVRYVRSLSD